MQNLVITAMQRHRPPTVKAARQATATTPIVAIDLETNSVLAGYAGSVARPGGNVTGLFIDMSCLAGDVVAAP
jgi:putative ABC transport system substrate-binding protein